MYAIIEVGGKQFRVEKDEVLDVEKLIIDPGEKLVLDKVLLVASGDNVDIGQPYLKGASVTCACVDQVKGEKIVSYKYRRRKSSHWKKGHRQQLTRIKVDEIKS